MKDNIDLLSSALKTVQMGQVGIRSVQKLPLRKDLQVVLSDQLKEYDNIERQVMSLASSRGWELDDLHPVAKTMAKATTRTKLAGGRSNSKTAAMMIQGNTRGMIKGLKNLHACSRVDGQVENLCQRLLDCEKSNITQMQGFL